LLFFAADLKSKCPLIRIHLLLLHTSIRCFIKMESFNERILKDRKFENILTQFSCFPWKLNRIYFFQIFLVLVLSKLKSFLVFLWNTRYCSSFLYKSNLLPEICICKECLKQIHWSPHLFCDHFHTEFIREDQNKGH